MRMALARFDILRICETSSLCWRAAPNARNHKKRSCATHSLCIFLKSSKSVWMNGSVKDRYYCCWREEFRTWTVPVGRYLSACWLGPLEGIASHSIEKYASCRCNIAEKSTIDLEKAERWPQRALVGLWPSIPLCRVPLSSVLPFHSTSDHNNFSAYAQRLSTTRTRQTQSCNCQKDSRCRRPRIQNHQHGREQER